jgi:short-subunit dehydrogenase
MGGGEALSGDRGAGGGAKVVLITGASAGIGQAVAREAARKGYHLALTARRAGRLERLARECESLGVEAQAIPAALDDPEAPARVVDEALARFGRLDALINNAGFGLPSLFAASEPAELRRQLEVNLVAPLLLARFALPALRETRGVIVNVGSAITSLANPALGAYGATKAGLAYWSSALRRELRHQGVQVCLIEPGPVKTEFFDAFTRLGPDPGTYHAMLDAPAPWMSAPVEDVARRVVRLIERPRRRLSVRRRFVWPWRLLGGLFQVFPGLGDLAVSSVVRYYESVEPCQVDPSTRGSHVASAE